MTNERLYSLMVGIVRDFAQLEKDNCKIAETAETLINDPASWLVKYGNVSLHPAVALMEKAASVMVDCVEKMNAKSGSEKTVAAAAKRIYKSAAASANTSCHGSFEEGGYFNLCDGFRILRTVKDFPALPKLPENTPRLKISAMMEKTINDGRKVEIVPPSIAEVKAFLAAEKERIKDVKNANPRPYIFKDASERPLIGFNPQFVIDALEVLPGAKWYGINDLSPVYIVSEDGDSLLLPVNIRNTAAGTTKDELLKSWEALRTNYFPQLAAAEAAEYPQTNTTEAEAEAQPTTEAEEKAEAIKASAEAPAGEAKTPTERPAEAEEASTEKQEEKLLGLVVVDQEGKPQPKEKRQRQSRHRLTVTAFGSLVGWGKADTRQQKAAQARSASSAKNTSVLRRSADFTLSALSARSEKFCLIYS